MSWIELHLPQELERYVNDQVARGGYKDVSEFMADLVEADKYRRTRQEVEAMLLEAVDGPFAPWTDQDVEDIRNEGLKLLAQRKSK